MRKKDRQHLGLLCDISEIAAILSGSEDVRAFLQKAVELVGRHLDADVSSIYLLDQLSQKLVLEATKGLNQDAVGNICLDIGEGLVGRTFEQLAPLNVGSAGSHPGFRYFEDAGEDGFNSFLAVPIQRGEEKIGVLVAQHRARDYFGETDVLAMIAIASQLAGAIGNARLVSSLSHMREHIEQMPTLPNRINYTKGEVASPGHAFALSTVYDRRREGRLPVDVSHESGYTLKDFRDAVHATAGQIEELQYRFAHRLPESVSLIFTAHMMILKDGRFTGEMEKLIKQQAELQNFDEKLRHYADKKICIELDDGVKVNYGRFGDLLAEVKTVTSKSTA